MLQSKKCAPLDAGMRTQSCTAEQKPPCRETLPSRGAHLFSTPSIFTTPKHALLMQRLLASTLL